AGAGRSGSPPTPFPQVSGPLWVCWAVWGWRLAGSGPVAVGDVGDAGLVGGAGAFGGVAGAVRGHLVVEGVWPAFGDGVDVVDLEAEWVEVVGVVVDGFAAPVAGRAALGDDAAV